MRSSSSPDLKPIGGFFELEFPAQGAAIHEDAIALSTGRSCLCAILDFLKPTRCYLPHYTCDATLAPFHQRNIEVMFYELDAHLQPKTTPELQTDECFLLTNYWGLQRELGARLSANYVDRLIVDDTHDFHAQGLYPLSWSFTSARKHFGVPDGAFLYIPEGVETEKVLPQATPEFQGISTAHSINRSLGKQEQAFAEYQVYEKSLPCELHRISSISREMLASVDFEAASARRRANFVCLAGALEHRNRIQVCSDPELTPFVYPFLPSKPISKAEYHRERIFVPTYWPDVTQRPAVNCKTSIDYAQNLIPLPIDHRYGPDEMQRMIDVTNRLLNEQ